MDSALQILCSVIGGGIVIALTKAFVWCLNSRRKKREGRERGIKALIALADRLKNAERKRDLDVLVGYISAELANCRHIQLMVRARTGAAILLAAVIQVVAVNSPDIYIGWVIAICGYLLVGIAWGLDTGSAEGENMALLMKGLREHYFNQEPLKEFFNENSAMILGTESQAK